MAATTAVAIGLLAIVTLLHLKWTWGLLQLFRRRTPPSIPEGDLPKVGVLLTLRGADPFLDRCLRGLLSQNYPRYEVRIVVDSPQDPAWPLVHRIVAECGSGRVTVSALKNPRQTCSLRMSALIQAAAELDDSCEVIVTVDADVVPHANWLRELVQPFADPATGAATGIRWYMPEDVSVGTLVRYVWNATAISQMHAFGIGWGGSLAVRMRHFRDARILEKWSRAMFDDAYLVNEVQALGVKLEFVPEATMINHESISLTSCMRFISRQLLNGRMYHRSWPLVFGFAAALTVAVTATPVVAAAALLSGATSLALVACGALGTYFAVMSGLLLWTEFQVRSLAQRRGEAVTPLSWKFFWIGFNLLWTGLFTQIVFPICVLRACRVREIEWRGIRYRLRGSRDVRLLEYRPYQPLPELPDAPVSL
jgi:cellulose synthase/poly-beta-1,6-N-acetylglucosamine synthase-like glycosyltransferase